MQFCLDSLREALPGFAYLGPLAAMFCESATANGHALPTEVNRYLGGRSWQSFSREEKLDCCDRLTYVQPIQMLVERLDPGIGSAFEDDWKSFVEAHGGDGPSSSGAMSMDGAMHIHTLMNP
jgi:hypothetical protein